MSEAKYPVHLWLSKEQTMALEKLSHQQSMSITEYIEKLVREHIEQATKPNMCSQRFDMREGAGDGE